MKWHFLKIVSLFVLFILLSPLQLFAETASTTHDIRLEVSASIVLYVDHSYQIFGIFHIAGSKELMDFSDIAAYRNGVNMPLTDELIAQYLAIAESDEVNWGTTGYYPVGAAGPNATASGEQEKLIRIVTVIQDV